MHVDAAFGKLLSGDHEIAIFHPQRISCRNKYLEYFILLAGDGDRVFSHFDGTVIGSANVFAAVLGHERMIAQYRITVLDVQSVMLCVEFIGRGRHMCAFDLDDAIFIRPQGFIFNNDLTFNRSDDRFLFGWSCFEKFLDTGQALRDVTASDASRMEGTHRELGSRFADALRCDNTDRGAFCYEGIVAEFVAIAFLADAAY